MPRLPVALQSYRHPTLPVSAQDVVNLYVEAQPQDAKARTVALFTPGAERFTACGAGPIRGMRFFRDSLIVVSAGQVWRVTRDGTAEQVGSAPGGGPVRLADDGNWLAIVDVQSAETRLLRLTDVVSIADMDFPGAKDVAVIGGYFAFLRPESETARGQWFISALRDPENYDALDFISAEARPDPAVAIAVLDIGVWVLGRDTIEVYSNTGRNAFPFERAPGGVIDRGCIAQMSAVSMAGFLYWLGDDGAAYRANSSTPQKISTPALEQSWQLAGDLSGAAATAYQVGEHKFYLLRVAGKTYVFDAANGLWHRRQSRGLDHYRMGNMANAWGGLYAGDTEDGTIWRIDPMLRTEGGAVIEREAVTAPLHGDGARMFMSRVAIEFDAGHGLITGQGSDPQAMLQWSDDGGRTWGNEHWRGIGRQGEYQRRAEWRRLGSFRERTLKIRITDPVGSALMAMQVDADMGAV